MTTNLASAALLPAAVAPGSGSGLVRIEDPFALFVPERYLTSTVPLPLYLLELVPGSVKSDYERTRTGIVANESDRIRRRTLRYPGGVRCEVEVHGDQVRGLPTTFDYDYFLALCRIADEGGVDAHGYFLEPGYRAVLRAAGRADDAIGGDQVEAVKRAFARFAGLIIHTRLELDFGERVAAMHAGAAPPLVPDGAPAFREREGKHWVLEYDVEAERRRSGEVTAAYNAIERLRINPIWLNQTAAGIAAWLDIDLHNSLRSGYAKRLLQLFTVRAARGWRVFDPWVVGLRELYVLLEVPETQWGKTQTRLGVSSALATLAERQVLGLAEIVKLGKGSYEVRLAAGERLLAAGYQRGIGALDSLADRMLLWHLRSVGFSSAQARELVRKRPAQVRSVLRRVYYLQRVKGGISNGRHIEDWNAWIRSAIEEEWSFADPEWQRWLGAQLTLGERGAPLSLTPAALPAARATDEPEADPQTASSDLDGDSAPDVQYPDDLWGRAVAAFVAEAGDLRIYTTWLARTALEGVTEEAVDVTAEDGFVAEWVTKKYGDALAGHLSALAGRPVVLRITSTSRQSMLPTAVPTTAVPTV